jgi:hypothetical protein
MATRLRPFPGEEWEPSQANQEMLTIGPSVAVFANLPEGDTVELT